MEAPSCCDFFQTSKFPIPIWLKHLCILIFITEHEYYRSTNIYLVRDQSRGRFDEQNIPQVSRDAQLFTLTLDSCFESSLIRFARGNVCQTLISPNTLHRKRNSPAPRFQVWEVFPSICFCAYKTRHPTIQPRGSLFQKCPSSGGAAGTLGEESGHPDSA